MEKILIIDAEDIQRKTLREILTREGYDVVETPDGQKGVKSIRESEEYSFVYVADQLDGLSGIDTLMGIKKYRPKIPVIMLLENPERETILHAVRRGASDFLHKPIRGVEVLFSLENVKERMRLKMDIDRQLERLRLLEKSTGELLSVEMEDLVPEDVIREDRFLRKTIDLIAEVLEVKKVSLMLIDKKTDELVMAQSNWMPSEITATVRQPLSKGVAGWVVRERKPILINDVKKDKRFQAAYFSRQYDSPSFICTPLFFKKKVIGVINANDRKKNGGFSEGDLSILNTFAHQISLAIANLSMIRKVKKEHLKLSIINDVVVGLISSSDPAEIYPSLVDRVRTVVRADAAALVILDEAQENLQYEAISADMPMEIKTGPFKPRGIFAEVLNTGNPALINEPKKHPSANTKTDFPRGIEPRGIIAVPLKIKGRILGILACYNKEDKAAFDHWDQEILEAVAPQASMAMKNAWLHHNLVKSIDEIVATNRQLGEANLEIREKIKELHRLKKRASS